MTSELRDGEDLEDEYYMTGIRTQKAYLLLEGELEALIYLPWAWQRRRVINRVKANTRFDDSDSDRSGEADETGTGSAVGESAGPEGIAQKGPSQ